MDKRALLLTRPIESAHRFAARLSLGDVPVCVSPLLEISPSGQPPDLRGCDGVIFTSANAVTVAPTGQGRSAYCVGTGTATSARARDWKVELVAQTADELVGMIREVNTVGPLAHLAGTHRRGEIAQRLRQSGTAVEVVTLYEQNLGPLSEEAQNLLSGEVCVIVPLFSPRTATQFADQAHRLDRVIIVAISPAVADCVKELPVADVHIAQGPTGREMVDLVEMLLHKDRLP